MARKKGSSKSRASKRNTGGSLQRGVSASAARQERIGKAKRTLSVAQKANRAATARPDKKPGGLIQKAEGVRAQGFTSYIVAPTYIKEPFKAVPAYKPKKGGLASRATPTKPRQSNKSLQAAQSAWSTRERPRQSKGQYISKARLAEINRSRKTTRNSLKPLDNCVKKPEPTKAGKIRASGSGGNYQFRKWC